MPLTIAILGCGKRGSDKVGWAIGHCHAIGWLAAAPDALLLGVDPNPENLAAFGESFKLPPAQLFSSVEALYATHSPDCVSVCTWPELHAPMVIEAATRGAKAIVCEKPAALDPGEIEAMVAACDAAGARLAIAHQRRYEPIFVRFRELARTAIGGARCLEARIGDGWDVLSWAVHWMDLAAFIFDSPAERVTAGIDCTGARRYGQNIENACVALVEFSEGRQMLLVSGAAQPDEAMLTVRGDAGMLQLRGSELHLWNHRGFSIEQPSGEWVDGFRGLMRDLVSVMGTDAPFRCDARQARRATELAYACHESARTRRTISLPMETRFAPLDLDEHPVRLLPQLPGDVVLWADGHFGSGGREGLAEALAALTGKAPRVVDAESKALDATDLSAASVLVVYHTQSEPGEATRAALEAWVEAGRPLVLVHAALGAFPKWDSYKRWCGRVWSWGVSEHPHEPSALRSISPAWGGFSSAWIPKDEVFIKLGQTAPTEDLVVARIGAGEFPAAWRSASWRNIVVWVPGHRRDTWSVPALRAGLGTILRATLGSA